jgi:polysaccharide deacetylase 2 family uncharacterized protein YibQ
VKKSPLSLFLIAVLGLCILGVVGWIVFGSPLPLPKHEMPPPVHVKVEQSGAGITLPATGDEKAVPQAVTEVPVSPAVADIPSPPQAIGDEKSEPEAVTVVPLSLPPPPAASGNSFQPAAPQPPQQVATITPAPVPDINLPHNGPPKIAIVIDDLGLDIGGTKRAIALPPFVTLSFMPYATRLKEQTKEGRDGGHELLLHMPMEPVGHEDPGPGALFVALPPEEIRKRFQTALASFTGFDGVNNHMGSKFTANAAAMEIVIDEIQQRSLFFLDSRTSNKTVGESIARQHGVPTIGRDVFLDDDEAIAAVREQMEQAERIARRKGSAVVIGHPHVHTLEALETWLPDAQSRGFVFVPLRELINPGHD